MAAVRSTFPRHERFGMRALYRARRDNEPVLPHGGGAARPRPAPAAREAPRPDTGTYRVAVLSDIHGNLIALDTVVADLERRRVDHVFNLGDHASGPLWPAETIRYLMRQDWTHILGNHDRQLIREDPAGLGPSDRHALESLGAPERDWLRRLLGFVKGGEELVLFHGTPSSDTTYLLETVERGRVRAATMPEIERRLHTNVTRVLLCGHTHVPRIMEWPGRWLIVNPGSVGLPAYEDEEPEPHVVETGSPHARYAILERRADGWGVELISVPYDHDRAADQARRNGRPDWEIGLRTGYMS